MQKILLLALLLLSLPLISAFGQDGLSTESSQTTDLIDSSQADLSTLELMMQNQQSKIDDLTLKLVSSQNKINEAKKDSTISAEHLAELQTTHDNLVKEQQERLKLYAELAESYNKLKASSKAKAKVIIALSVIIVIETILILVLIPKK
jgi:septal ring factor EnvC (AmiA/AmiB activator)